jgi:hypothetical protein
MGRGKQGCADEAPETAFYNRPIPKKERRGLGGTKIHTERLLLGSTPSLEGNIKF